MMATTTTMLAQLDSPTTEGRAAKVTASVTARTSSSGGVGRASSPSASDAEMSASGMEPSTQAMSRWMQAGRMDGEFMMGWESAQRQTCLSARVDSIVTSLQQAAAANHDIGETTESETSIEAQMSQQIVGDGSLDAIVSTRQHGGSGLTMQMWLEQPRYLGEYMAGQKPSDRRREFFAQMDLVLLDLEQAFPDMGTNIDGAD